METKINNNLIKNILKIYSPKYRWLKSASEESPFFRGNFEIQRGLYTMVPVNHLTDIESTFCINQLWYASFAHMIQKTGNIRGINLEKFYKLQKEGTLITDIQKKFRKKADTTKEISALLHITNSKDIKNMLIYVAEFNIENKSCSGNLRALIEKK